MPLGKLLVVAMQIAEDRLQPYHPLAVQGHIHAEDAVRRGMMRPHRHFKQVPVTFRFNHRGAVPTVWLVDASRRGREFIRHSHWLAPVPCCPAPSWFAPANLA